MEAEGREEGKMRYKERLEKMIVAYGGYKPRHCELAARVLTKLANEFVKRGIVTTDDKNWPFHILVQSYDGMYVSLHCSGFSKAIDIHPLSRDGSPDRRFNEVRFATPVGAANYVERRWVKG